MSGIVARFLDPLVLEEVAGGPYWRLIRELRFDSAVMGARVIVPPGTVTDLASVPRWPFAFWLAGDTGRKAGVIHDWLYVHQLESRARADAVFYEALAAERVPSWRQWLMWAAVRLRGGRYW